MLIRGLVSSLRRGLGSEASFSSPGMSLKVKPFPLVSECFRLCVNLFVLIRGLVSSLRRGLGSEASFSSPGMSLNVKPFPLVSECFRLCVNLVVDYKGTSECIEKRPRIRGLVLESRCVFKYETFSITF